MPNHDLVNRDLAFLNEYRTSIGIKLLLLHVLCYTTNDPSAQRKQFFADSKDALKLYRTFRNEELQPMLNIYFGDMPSAIYNTEIYFKNTYEDSWILDDFAKKVIKKVDGSESVEEAERNCHKNRFYFWPFHAILQIENFA